MRPLLHPNVQKGQLCEVDLAQIQLQMTNSWQHPMTHLCPMQCPIDHVTHLFISKWFTSCLSKANCAIFSTPSSMLLYGEAVMELKSHIFLLCSYWLLNVSEPTYLDPPCKTWCPRSFILKQKVVGFGKLNSLN